MTGMIIVMAGYLYSSAACWVQCGLGLRTILIAGLGIIQAREQTTVRFRTVDLHIRGVGSFAGLRIVVVRRTRSFLFSGNLAL